METPVQLRWRRRFLGMAAYIADWSKDTSTQCGAVLVRPNKTVASLGFNGFPQALPDDPAMLQDREAKLDRIIHAEMNALTFLREPSLGLWLFVHPMLPCHRCAVHVIQAGISCVVAPAGGPDRWKESMDLTKRLFAEAKVQVLLEDPNAVEENPEGDFEFSSRGRSADNDVLQRTFGRPSISEYEL